jgi:zinc-ribbon domain/Domain of unknown function (DUF4352)
MAEAPSRYCGNCGNELSPEDQFCRNCGTPVHRAATVPTPEAHVPVPPPPQPAQAGFGRRHPILTGCLAIVGLLFVLAIVAAALGGGGDETAGDGGGEGGQQAQETDQGQQNQPQGQDEAQDQGQDQGQETRPARIGQTVVIGDAAYRVTRAWRETELRDPSGFKEPMQGNFVLVDFTVENRGEEPMSVSDLGLYVYDSGGSVIRLPTP